ncbi:MAG: dihydrofolate reductase [Candidatus Latescibacterota bacterium]|jgi:dihydrofolate reductase
MKVSLIAAVSPDLIIGREGDMPWHYPIDMRHFMDTTIGHPCIMGRLTYESFPRRPLPRRPNLVLTRNADYVLKTGAVRFDNLLAALDHCRAEDRPVVYICGGGGVYREALPLADEMIITHVPDRVEGDTHFPAWKPEEWQVVDEKSEEDLRFSVYQRRS